MAADSITNTMSSLVKELNSEVASETESTVDSEFSRPQFEDLAPSPTSEKAFLAQIHSRKPGYIHGGAASTTHGDMVPEDGDPYTQPEDGNYENESVRQLENELQLEEYLKQKLQDEAYQLHVSTETRLKHPCPVAETKWRVLFWGFVIVGGFLSLALQIYFWGLF